MKYFSQDKFKRIKIVRKLVVKRMSLIYKTESYDIIGACMEVHKELGCGFLEAVYQEALELVFLEINIPYKKEKELTINFKGKKLIKTYLADFVCYEKIILELKSVAEISNIHEAQVFNYLKVTGYKLGLLVNFGEKSLTYKRIVI